MTLEEVKRAEVLSLVEEKSITMSEGAVRASLSKRHFRRLRQRYKLGGAEELCHRSRGRPSGRALAAKKRAKVVKSLKTTYRGFGPTLAAEKISKKLRLPISREKVRQLQIEEGLWTPKQKRKGGYHPRRTRRSREGELVQADGSDHDWLSGRGPRMTLIVFIDDATSRIKLARFVESESTRNYSLMMKDYLQRFGVPGALFTDKHSIFRQTDKDVRERGKLTQFGRALEEVGVELICANSPQSKGRVERVFGTLQDRLVKELALAKVSTLEQANQFLEGYLKEHNDRFAVSAADSSDAHRSLSRGLDLDRVFGKRDQRRLSANLSFQFQNTLYQVKTDRPNRLKHKPIHVVETLDGRMIVETTDKTTLTVEAYQEFKTKQRTIDSKEIASMQINRKRPKPGKHHPWR